VWNKERQGHEVRQTMGVCVVSAYELK